MQQQSLLQNINRNLAILCVEVEGSNSMNFNSLSVAAEQFFKELLNLIYSKNNLNLRNSNRDKSNYAAIDLDDENSRISYQITSQNTGKKIEETINSFTSKKLYESFDKLVFIFIKMSIAESLRKRACTKENFTVEVIDIKKLLKIISELDLHLLIKVNDFIELSIKKTNISNITIDEYLFREIFEILKEGIPYSSEDISVDQEKYNSNLNHKKEVFYLHWDDLVQLYLNSGESSNEFNEMTLFTNYEEIIKTCFSTRLNESEKIHLEKYLRTESIIFLKKNNNDPLNAINEMAINLQNIFKLNFISKTMIISFLLNMFFACDVFPMHIKTSR